MFTDKAISDLGGAHNRILDASPRRRVTVNRAYRRAVCDGQIKFESIFLPHGVKQ